LRRFPLLLSTSSSCGDQAEGKEEGSKPPPRPAPVYRTGHGQNVSFHDLIVFICGGDSILISLTTPVENPTKIDDWPDG
jgi:hypothetical protein